ncbi:MAG: efflux RND transporter permease subunit, partial [Alphaproteobacteria bacterium]
ATPYEIEDAITSRVEEALVGIEGVKRIASKASEGYGLVNVELEDFANSDDVYNDVETNVNALSEFPPDQAERPIISKVRITPTVMTLALHGEADEKTLRYWAETIEDDLRLLGGVAQTSLSGVRAYQISVEVPENALRQYDLTLEEVQSAIQQFSRDIPAGTVEAPQGDIMLRVQEKRYTGEEFESIVLRTLPDGSRLTIGDIGNVIDGFVDTNLVSKFNKERSAFIEIFRSETADTIEVSANIKDYIQDLTLPKGLTLSIQQDRTIILQERISLMMRNAILGFMLVFLILLLFLDLKLAFWTSVAIPVSFLGGMMIIYFMGYSLNMISLFALIVVLGIVVDDAIVTGESIFESHQENPDNPNATLIGVKRVIAPVTVGVATTMAAFAPLIFSTGTLGQIIGIIPIVVIPILFISLIEAYFILPAHLSSPKKWSKGIISGIRNFCAHKLRVFTEKILGPAAQFCMQWRYAILALFIGFAIITFSMVANGTIRFIFFPNIEGDEIAIDVEMPVGTPFSVTEATMLRIEKEALEVRANLEAERGNIFESMTLSIGERSNDGGPGRGPGSSSANNIGQLKIKMVSSDFRDISAPQVEDKIRARIENIPGIEELKFQSSLVGDNPDIEVQLSHPDIEILRQAAETLKDNLGRINGTMEISDTFDVGKTEYVFSLTDEGLAAGLTPQALGQQLRGAFFGLEAQRFQRGNSEVIVYVRYPENEREDISLLQSKRIRLQDGTEVPLSVVADIKVQQGFSRIETVNGRRIVSVTADVDKTLSTEGEVTQILSEEFFPQLKAQYTGLSVQFEGESRERQEDLASLGKNMLIALMLIYVLLGAQLRSYIQPVIIMSAIPFGVIGAIWGHYLLGYDLTFISLFGIVALTGVVVNDSVVLMDYLNHQRFEKSLSVFDSAISAIKRRFRPILLTTLTTSLGLLPMLLETSLQAQFLIPMVVSLATGILFATVIILVLIPVLVLIVEDIKHIPSRLHGFIKRA